jgi:hypothetical protein
VRDESWEGFPRQRQPLLAPLNTDEVSLLGSGFGRDDWLRLSANAIAQHPYCSNCRSTEDLTADHIVPKARGGRNVLSNVQVLCRSCNSGKREGGRDRLEGSSQRNPPPASREKNERRQGRGGKSTPSFSLAVDDRD